LGHGAGCGACPKHCELLRSGMEGVRSMCCPSEGRESGHVCMLIGLYVCMRVHACVLCRLSLVSDRPFRSRSHVWVSRFV
jgi:hypothetical protein